MLPLPFRERAGVRVKVSIFQVLFFPLPFSPPPGEGKMRLFTNGSVDIIEFSSIGKKQESDKLSNYYPIVFSTQELHILPGGPFELRVSQQSGRMVGNNQFCPLVRM